VRAAPAGVRLPQPSCGSVSTGTTSFEGEPAYLKSDQSTVQRPSQGSSFFTDARCWTLLILTWAIVYLPGLFRPALLDDADSVHAEASREMLLNHDWVTLYTDGLRYLQKPPLLYWAVTISYKLFGVGEWQTRLPLALCVFGLIAATFIFGRRYFGREGGFYSAIVVATSLGVFVFTRFLISDVLVAMFLTLGLYFFLRASEQVQPSRSLCWALVSTIALGVLAKGLIAIVFPCLIIPVYLFLTGDLKKIWKLHLVSSAIIFFVIAAPWHILASLRNPAIPGTMAKGFFWSYFINEHVMRYLGKRVPYDYDKVDLGLFWGMLLIFLIPWIVFLVPALREIPSKIRTWRSNLDSRSRANLFCAIWAVMIMLFFSFSSRQEYYSLPAIPALALLIGGWMQRESESAADSRERRAGRVASLVLVVVGVAAFAATMWLLSQTHSFPAGTDIGAVLTPHPSRYKLSLGHMGDLSVESFGLFRAPLWEIGVGMLVGSLACWFFRRRGDAIKANFALLAMSLVILFCVWQGYIIFSPEIASKEIALEIKKMYQPGETIVINGVYETGSDLNFYTGIQVHVLNGVAGDLRFGSFWPDAPHVYEDDDSFVKLWNAPNRVYLFTPEYLKNRALKNLDPSTIYVLTRRGGKVVYTNRPVPAAEAPATGALGTNLPGLNAALNFGSHTVPPPSAGRAEVRTN
jgi:4-amino-4-deoxy-L-arabinose transferase-like glycosyltransferase